jgi:hypothetical protein
VLISRQGLANANLRSYSRCLEWQEDNYGIPAHQSVVMQVYPDFYMARTQQQFAGYFASLILLPIPEAYDDDGRPSPAYNVNVLTNYGSMIGVKVRPGYPTEQPI